MQQSRLNERTGPDPLIVIMLALGLLLTLPCVLVVLLSRRIPPRIIGWRGFWPLVAIFGACCLACFVLLAYPFHTLQGQLVSLLSEVVREAKTNTWSILKLWGDIRLIWLESLYFAPVATFAVHLFASHGAEQHMLASRRQRTATTRSISKRVERRMTRRRLPEQVQGQMVFGLPIEGDLQEWIMRGLFALPAPDLGKHGIVIGASGSGKSQTLLRIAVGAACVHGWQVIYIDGKGDEDAGIRFIAAMLSAGVQRVKMYPAEPYNGWVGNEEALLSRLLAVEEYSDTHYRAVAENLLRLAISVPQNPVKNSKDLLQRLNLTNGLLLALYAGDPEQEAYLTYLSKRDPLGVYNRYAALLGKLRGQLDGSWSFDTVDAAYVCLDGLALSGIVSGLGRYFVEDFSHYAGCRKPRDRRVLFIFDELSAVDVNLANLCERVRARGVSVFASGQSDSSIAYKGFTHNADRLFSTSTTIVLHACNQPENIIARAGTQYIVEHTAGVSGDEATGQGTIRIAESSKVDPNIVRELSTGEVFVLAHGKAHMVRVMPVKVNATAIEQAETYAQSAVTRADARSTLSESPSAPSSDAPLPSTIDQKAPPMSPSSPPEQVEDDAFLR